MTTGPKDDEAIFHAVIAKPASQRTAYLTAACAGDSDLLEHLEAMLQAYEAQDNFLEVPPTAEDVTLDSAALAEGPGSVMGRYRLVKRIGEGGMAVVYMAE